MKKDYADYLLKYSMEVYDDIAVQFSKTRNGFWSDLNFLIDYAKSGLKILDLGCGNGRLLNALKDKEVQYVGVDNSEKLLSEAQKNYPEYKDKFWKADALNLPFAENEFDMIYSIAVLQHIPSKEYRMKFLKECLRTLKKDGKLVLTVWLVKNGSNHYKKANNIFQRVKSLLKLSDFDYGDVMIPFVVDNVNLGDRYIHAFSLKELVMLVRKAGFKLIDSGYTKDDLGKKRNIYIVASKY